MNNSSRFYETYESTGNKTYKLDMENGIIRLYNNTNYNNSFILSPQSITIYDINQNQRVYISGVDGNIDISNKLTSNSVECHSITGCTTINSINTTKSRAYNIISDPNTQLWVELYNGIEWNVPMILGSQYNYGFNQQPFGYYELHSTTSGVFKIDYFISGTVYNFDPLLIANCRISIYFDFSDSVSNVLAGKMILTDPTHDNKFIISGSTTIKIPSLQILKLKCYLRFYVGSTPHTQYTTEIKGMWNLLIEQIE